MAKNDFLFVTSACDGRWKLYGYPTGRTSYAVEASPFFTTKAEADAALVRVKAGDESGMTFGSYDDGD